MSESVVPVLHVAGSKKPKKKITFIIIGSGLSVVALGASILFFLIVYVLKLVEPRKISWRNLLILHVRKAHKSSFRHHLSMDEIKVAANNFDEALVIGIGGFGKVYEASFDHGSTFAAIKRSNPMTEKGTSEFETEIHVLSQLRAKEKERRKVCGREEFFLYIPKMSHETRIQRCYLYNV